MNSVSVTRTVTNVGSFRSIYTAAVSSPKGINVTVVPNRLVFEKYGEKKSFTVYFTVAAPVKGYGFGFLSWRNKRLSVTSPIVVRVVSSTKSGLMR